MKDLFKNERQAYEKLEAPAQMEDKLREALEGSSKRPQRHWPKLASFILIGLLVLSSRSNTIADYFRPLDYGNKLLEDYSDLVDGNIKNLGLNSSIQPLEKSLDFKDYQLKFRGIIVDDLSSSLFVSSDSDRDFSLELLKPSKGSLVASSIGQPRQDGGYNYVYNIEGKTKGDSIELLLRDSESHEEKRISLELDPQASLGELERITLKNKISFAGHKYRLKSLIVTPMTMELRGESESLLSLGLRTILKKEKPPLDLDFRVLVNGERIEAYASSYKTDLTGSNFKFIYRDFPLEIESLELEIISKKDSSLVDRINIK